MTACVRVCVCLYVKSIRMYQYLCERLELILISNVFSKHSTPTHPHTHPFTRSPTHTHPHSYINLMRSHAERHFGKLFANLLFICPNAFQFQLSTEAECFLSLHTFRRRPIRKYTRICCNCKVIAIAGHRSIEVDMGVDSPVSQREFH